MLNIQKSLENDRALLRLEGRLDTVTAPELQQTLDQLLPETAELTLDFGALDYVSSAGLRVLLTAQKQMNRKAGSMKLVGVKKEILEVFEVTGFADILTIR